MKYDNVLSGRFVSRPNRFIAHVDINGHAEVCHVKNTGRCRELLTPGARVYLEPAKNPERKTKFDLIAVEKQDILINMDAQAPNKVFYEWAAKGQFLPAPLSIRPEFVWEDSRFDFLLEDKHGPVLVEVKGVTLEDNGVVLFPDAPTERGVKHLHGLTKAIRHGFRACAFFVVQMNGPACFRPNDATHPAFGHALRTAALAGVRILAYDCCVTSDSLTLNAPVPVEL